jgi:imidazolonepropionase
MPHVMNLACVNMRMTMAESLVAATINSAYALNKSNSHGSIEKGKVADLVVINSEKWEHVIYEIADPPIQTVIKRGKVVHSAQ